LLRKYSNLALVSAKIRVYLVVIGCPPCIAFAMAATEFAEASQVVKIMSGEVEPP
jgi:hypothetical protein